MERLQNHQNYESGFVKFTHKSEIDLKTEMMNQIIVKGVITAEQEPVTVIKYYREKGDALA